MKGEHTARFTVTVTSTENASWQGTVELGGVEQPFCSELELLRRILEHYPSLRPDMPHPPGQTDEK